MFGIQFYPTPPELVDEMVAPFAKEYDSRYGVKRKYITNTTGILEPSAGDGSILKHITDPTTYGYHVKNIYAIEIDVDLRAILAKDGFRIVDFDFLNYGKQPEHTFNLILMNPPFADADSHLLHAWHIIEKFGGDIACILPAEMLSNPYSKERELLLSVIAQHGETKNVGTPFADSRNPTNVECVIVWLHADEKKIVDFSNLDLEIEEAIAGIGEYQDTSLASRDPFVTLAAKYKLMMQCVNDMRLLRQKFVYFAQGVYEPKDWKESELAIDVRSSFWSYVFAKTGIANNASSRVAHEFQAFASSTRSVAFTADNIRAVLKEVLANRQKIVYECVTDVFDELTKYWKENLYHTEGWKSNKTYMVNRKLVIPTCVRYDNTFNSWSLEYGHRRDLLDDIDKAMCFVMDMVFTEIHATSKAINDRFSATSGKSLLRHSDKFESTFFNIRVFKKGTVHLEFKDEEVWAKFNQVATAGKAWIGNKEM